MIYRRILSSVALVVGAFLFSIGLQAFAAFTPPTAAPPQADAYAPLNTGPATQTKTGVLNVTGNVVRTGASYGWIGLTGDLPGYPVNDYPTLKTNGSYLYFANGTNYLAWLGSVYSGFMTERTEFRNPNGTGYSPIYAGDVTSSGAVQSTYPGGYDQTKLLQWGLYSPGRMYLEPGAGSDLYLTDQWSRTGTLDIEFGKVTIPTGNVGIGTTEPGYKLDVAGTAKADRVSLGWSGTTGDYYSIWREAGAWTYPYPDLVIQQHTGIKYDAYYGYGGHRFYTGYDGSGNPYGLAMRIGDDNNNVSVTNSLSVGGNITAAGKNVCLQDGTNCSASASIGSGTTNYVSKWTSGTTLGNSSIFDNGNVGIGTTVPNAKLELSGNSQASWPAASAMFTDTGASGIKYALGSRNGFGFSISDETNLAFRFVVSPTGNVGIGTASPGAKLDVAGDIRAGDLTVGGNLSVGGKYYDQNDTSYYLDPNGTSRVKQMEVKGDVYIVGSNTDQANWYCQKVNLQDTCGDENGCTIKLILGHETVGDDQTLSSTEFINMEDQQLSRNNGVGVYGVTTQSAGGYYQWISGASWWLGEIFAPWSWIYVHNFKHQFCANADPGVQGPAEPPYIFWIMAHPDVTAKVIVYD